MFNHKEEFKNPHTHNPIAVTLNNKIIPDINHTNHSWVELNDYIIDLTATQFNSNKDNKYPDILVTDKSDNLYIKLGETNVKSLKLFSEWNIKQIPKKKYINVILGIFKRLNNPKIIR